MTVYNLSFISLNGVLKIRCFPGSHLAGEGGGGLTKWPINNLHLGKHP